jgi:hypothetical protein
MAPASDPGTIKDRPWARYLFFGLATVGIVVSLVLGVREVHNRAELKVSNARVKEDGDVRTVQVTVTNRSKEAWCPVIMIAARKRNGADLAVLTAAPVGGKNKVAPKQTVGFKVVFDHLTQKDFDRLDKFVGYVDSQVRC